MGVKVFLAVWGILAVLIGCVFVVKFGRSRGRGRGGLLISGVFVLVGVVIVGLGLGVLL
ncbi:hypothetical protein ACFQ9X_15045 [Catenulispora yoronensis]